MTNYSPRLQPKKNLKYIGIKISDETKADDTRTSKYTGKKINLYDVTKFSCNPSASTKTKWRYLEYNVHLCLNSSIYWKNGRPVYSVNAETLGESTTDILLNSIKQDGTLLSFKDISEYVQLYRN